ncbi:hypothetical protein C8R44DRAFT_785891 [Mycena epipterygia]|nr:hypothetical protein C8R44DRAFT_785891 [Mycena epipterygia]
MSRSPGPLYRLAYGLSLTQIASGLATIFVYEIDDARDSQFIAILYAVTTFYMVYMLIPSTMQRDNDPVSRLNKQFVIINFLLLCWVLSLAIVPLTVGAYITRDISDCVSVHFMTPKCLTLGLDMTLPFALIVTLGTISYTIFRGARALQAAPKLPSYSQLPSENQIPPRNQDENENENPNQDENQDDQPPAYAPPPRPFKPRGAPAPLIDLSPVPVAVPVADLV